MISLFYLAVFILVWHRFFSDVDYTQLIHFMKNNIWPEDKLKVIFTDMQGVKRKGTYQKGLNGFVESLVEEVPGGNGYIYPEEDVIEWERLHQ